MQPFPPPETLAAESSNRNLENNARNSGSERESTKNRMNGYVLVIRMYYPCLILTEESRWFLPLGGWVDGVLTQEHIESLRRQRDVRRSWVKSGRCGWVFWRCREKPEMNWEAYREFKVI